MSSNIIGSLIWIMFIFLSLFTHMIIKSLTGEVDFIITLFSRFAYSLPILFILAYIARKSYLFQVNNWKNIALRSFFGFVTMIMVLMRGLACKRSSECVNIGLSPNCQNCFSSTLFFDDQPDDPPE